MEKNSFISGIRKKHQMDIEIMGKIGRRLDEGQEKCEALINGFLDYMIEQVLKTDCSDPLVDDMGFLLDLYDCNSNQSKQDEDIFYANILVEFITCFEDLNKDNCRIVLDKLFDSSTQKCSIKRLENVISFVPSDDNKENMITLFNYINKEFVKKNEYGNTKYKK